MRASLAVTAALLVAAFAGAAADAAPRSTAVGVAQREFRLSLYRSTVPPGTVRFNVTNFGEDAHDLAVIGPNGRQVAISPEIRAGRRHTLAVRLAKPGAYRLLCTKLDHPARGMRATLRVKR